MSAHWEKAVARFESEASAILKEHGLPNDPIAVIAVVADNKAPFDRMVSAAIMVVTGARYLRNDIARGRTSQALDRLLHICESYEEMVILRGVPEYRKTSYITDHLLGDIKRGFKVKFSASAGGKAKETPPDVVGRWQATADEIWKRNRHLSVRAVAERLAPLLGAPPNTIRTKIRKPST